MPPSPLTRRVQILEEKVERLERLPARIDNLEVQILQCREEVRIGFSAVNAQLATLEARIAEGDQETRRFMRILHEDLVARIATIGEGRSHE
jgi:hypothetical protein